MNEAEARAEHIDPALAGAVIELLDKQRTDLSAACLMQGRPRRSISGVVRRVRDVLEVIWRDRSETIQLR